MKRDIFTISVDRSISESGWLDIRGALAEFLYPEESVYADIYHPLVF